MKSAATYQIDRAEVLRYLGYGGQQLDPVFSERLDEAIGRCQAVSNPAFTYRIFPVCASQDGVHLAGTTLVLGGDDVAGHLAGARECAVMVATAGLSNERELQRLSCLNGLDAMLFDAAGSALVEAVADACNAQVAQDGRDRGLFAKWRFSPGYGDFPLGIQPQIIRVLAADRKLGVTATESSLLIPTKSVTAFVGLFDTPQDDARSCDRCSFAAHCKMKREGTPCYR